MTGYVRKDTTNNIADGNVINAADLDAEFDGVQDAFNASTGHNHDGTSGEGAPITALGPTQDVTISAILLAPKTNNTVDIGSSSLKFKDLFLAGNGSIGGTLAVTGVATFTAQPILSSLTASRAVFSDGSKGLVSNAITGTGNVVMSASPTLTGTIAAEALSASSTVTLSGGTANGVAYLNGSKVVTSGSALTFDGTTFVAPITSLSGNGVVLTVDRTGTGGNDRTNVQFSNSGTVRGGIGTLGAADGIYFNQGTTEGMRLTSTGLGIGTSSPQSTYKLTISGTDSVFPAVYLDNTTNSKAYSMRVTGTSWIIRDNTAGADRLNLDTSGNLGLGVTPSAWATYTALQINNGSVSNYSPTQDMRISSNAYYNSGWKYIASAPACQYLLDGSNGGHQWFTAPSGTAGNAITFTQAMTLDASGNLGVGTTSPFSSARLQVKTATNINLAVQTGTSDATGVKLNAFNDAASVNIPIELNGSIVILKTGETERARIDSSGNLLLGTTTAGAKFTLEYVGTSAVGQNINDSANTTNSTLMQFLIQGTQAGTIKRVGTTSAVVYNTTSDYRLKTVTGDVTGQGARIDALKPVDYQWKEGGQQARGFLAHEFQTVYPNSVSGDKDAIDADGNPVYQAMQAATSEVIADLVAEIKALRQRVAQLEAQ